MGGGIGGSSCRGTKGGILKGWCMCVIGRGALLWLEAGEIAAPLVGQVVMEEVAVQKELFYTEGAEDLKEARNNLADWSRKRAAGRLRAAQQQRRDLEALRVSGVRMGCGWGWGKGCGRCGLSMCIALERLVLVLHGTGRGRRGEERTQRVEGRNGGAVGGEGGRGEGRERGAGGKKKREGRQGVWERRNGGRRKILGFWNGGSKRGGEALGEGEGMKWWGTGWEGQGV